MATKERVTKVWIEEGCIVCDACENAAPTVFEVTEDTCVIRPEALNPEFTKPLSESIIDAAEECPVDVIKFESVTEEVPEAEQAVAEPSGAEAAAPAETTETAEAEAAAAKAPEAPAAAAKRELREAAAAKAPAAPPSGAEPEPSIAALLQAATARGGKAGIHREEESASVPAQPVKRKRPVYLPPDARQAKILQAAREARKHPDRKRRAIVGGTALGIGWLAFGVGGGISSTLALARFMMPNVLEEPDPRVRVGKLQRYLEMAPGEVIEDYKPQGIWMIRDGDRLAALSIICTHLGCIPNWLPNDRKFKCPCHGSGYKPNGINFEGPTPRPLERFRLFVEDGVVVVDKSKKYQYELGQWDFPGSYLEV